MTNHTTHYWEGHAAACDRMADFGNPYILNGEEFAYDQWEAGFKDGLKCTRPRTLSDIMYEEYLEWEASPEGRAALDREMAEEAAADLETERRSEAYWETNWSPAYQQECMDDLALFEQTWEGNR